MGRPPIAYADRWPTDLESVTALAAVLAGSTRGAAELLADGLAGDQSWSSAADDYDLAPRLRTTLVRAYLASPLGRSRVPDHRGGGRQPTGLDALTGPARAAVALRDGDQLTTAEIITILDRPAKRVAADLAATAPGQHDAEIAALRALAPAAEQVRARYEPAVRALRRSRRRRATLVGLAVILVLAAVAVPTVVLPRLPVDVRERGAWRYSHEVRLAPGWELITRSIQAEVETTVVRVPWFNDEDARCTVTVRVPGVPTDRSGELEPTSVHGRRAEFVVLAGNRVSLNWEYAPGAWASTECDAQAAVSPAVLQELAAAVRFRDARQLLPFTLTALPEGYRIETVGESYGPYYGDVDWGTAVLLVPPENSFRPSLIVGPDLSSYDFSVGSCLGPDRAVCVHAFGTDDQVPANRGLLRATVSKAMVDVRLAPDPADRDTWFDAIDLPTG